MEKLKVLLADISILDRFKKHPMQKCVPEGNKLKMIIFAYSIKWKYFMENFIELLKVNYPKLKSKYPIDSMALFGSVLREDFDELNSDIDIMVDFTGDNFELFLKLADELEFLTQKRVDLVTLRSLKPRHYEYLKNEFIYVS